MSTGERPENVQEQQDATNPIVEPVGASISRLQHQNANVSRSTLPPPHAIGTREITDEGLYDYDPDAAQANNGHACHVPNPLTPGSFPEQRQNGLASAFSALSLSSVAEDDQGRGPRVKLDSVEVAGRAELDAVDIAEGTDSSCDSDDDPEDLGYDTVWQERINALRDFFEDPDSSGGAKLLSLGILFVICVSTMALVIETIPDFDNIEDKRNFFILESICIFLFTVEYVTRWFLAKKKCEFMSGGMNLIDLISILPFYFDLTLWCFGQVPYESESGASNLTRVLRLFRLVRVFRVFKLGRNSKSLLIAFKSVLASLDTLGLMVFILCIMLILFGAFVFNFEVGIWKEAPCPVDGSEQAKGCYMVTDDLGNDSISLYISIPEAMWWTVVTVMTVGYGDIFPVTPPGKFVASMCMVSSIVILALPISVIGINFSAMWSADENSTKMKESPLKLHGCGVAADRDLQMFNSAAGHYLDRFRHSQNSIRNRLGQLETELDQMHPNPSPDPRIQLKATIMEGDDPALSPQAASQGSDEPFAPGTSCTMEGMGNPPATAEGSQCRGVLHKVLLSQHTDRDQTCNRLFALKVDEVCMRALYDRVMVYFPLRRLAEPIEPEDKFLPREEADIAVQVMMLRTQHNAAVYARLFRQYRCIEEEFRAMQKFIKTDDIEPAVKEDAEEAS